MRTKPRMVRRKPFAMTDAAHRALDRFARTQGFSRDEALNFLCENLPRITDPERLSHRLRLAKIEAHSNPPAQADLP